ncbi:MAG: hypothetical protein ACYC0N_00370 [Carboxydocellales bacterium]
MTGNLKIYYAEGIILTTQTKEGITQEEAQQLVAEAITRYPNVQVTWAANNDSAK